MRWNTPTLFERQVVIPWILRIFDMKSAVSHETPWTKAFLPTLIQELFQGYKDNIHSANSEDYKKYRNAAKSPVDSMDDMVEASLLAVRRNKGNSRQYKEHDKSSNLFNRIKNE